MWSLAILTGDCINGVFVYENVWAFRREQKVAVITSSVTVNRVVVKWGSTVPVKLLSQYEVILLESHLFLSQQIMCHFCNLLRNNLLDLPSCHEHGKNKEKRMFELLDTGPVLFPLSCSQNLGNHESHFPGSYEIHVLQAATELAMFSASCV